MPGSIRESTLTFRTKFLMVKNSSSLSKLSARHWITSTKQHYRGFDTSYIYFVSIRAGCYNNITVSSVLNAKLSDPEQGLTKSTVFFKKNYYVKKLALYNSKFSIRNIESTEYY